MPDLDIIVEEKPRRVYELLHQATPVLLNFGRPGSLELRGWSECVQLVEARYDGVWELPVIGVVTSPVAVLIRPDGHVCWVGDHVQEGFIEALTKWFGPAA